MRDERRRAKRRARDEGPSAGGDEKKVRRWEDRACGRLRSASGFALRSSDFALRATPGQDAPTSRLRLEAMEGGIGNAECGKWEKGGKESELKCLKLRIKVKGQRGKDKALIKLNS
jgi:hypothetical protein